MTPYPVAPDPLDAVPDPETVRVMLAEANRRRDLLRSLLRVAVRKANYPPPSPRPESSADEGRKGVSGV
jgi:hypothetical protein